MRKEKRIQHIRGMPDVFPTETPFWQTIEHTWFEVVNSYGYAEIRTPLLEETRLFKRAIGDVTDIVEKEMFTFDDRDGVSMSLRPEGTASCIRACLEAGLLYNQTQKLWYQGPMFRYERPQKGRYRQFYQFGLESFGFESSMIELEHILMIKRFLKQLGLSQVVRLEINTLGDLYARQQYRQKLVAYLNDYVNLLDEESKRRLTTNPLRILDSKNPSMQALIEGAPKLLKELDIASQEKYCYFKQLLTAFGIEYIENPRLVRGLDYYNGFVYEWVTDQLGTQGTVCAGGRYDGLVEQLGGKQPYSTGCAMGIERIMLLLQSLNVSPVFGSPDVYMISVGSQAVHEHAIALAESLREQKGIALTIVQGLGVGSLKSQFKKADHAGAKWALIVSDKTLQEQKIALKFLREAKNQVELSITELETFFQNSAFQIRPDQTG